MNINVYKEFNLLFEHYPELVNKCKNDILSSFLMISECCKSGGIIMTCGNGGSAADANHIVGELMKGFKRKRKLTLKQRACIENVFPKEGPWLADNLQQAIPAISLVDQSALVSAFVNDVCPDMVYAQQVYGYGRGGDVLIGLSTSGNSRNVVNACKVAKALNIKTIGLTGEKGGDLCDICDVIIRVPAIDVYRVQEYHLPIYHTICSMLEVELINE